MYEKKGKQPSEMGGSVQIVAPVQTERYSMSSCYTARGMILRIE
jgi:hypothetical protein